VRIHLGHHFYGAGNLGDDFMLAGFLAAMRSLAPAARFTGGVPFALEPLRRRFPTIEWLPCDDASRADAIARCDVWLGLGGSPFQSAQSRWFIDHLAGEAVHCAQARKPMFYLGIGLQSPAELERPEARRLCAQAAGIWTRDAESARLLRAVAPAAPIETGADLAHIFFRDTPPPAAVPGRLALVPNFDFGTWPGQAECLAALAAWPASDRVWLAQESRDLPGAELALFASLSSDEKARWRLVSPEIPAAPLAEVLPRWPGAEWLVTARYHAALAGAWAGAKVVVLATNEKLRAAARDLQSPMLLPDAVATAVAAALARAVSSAPPRALATAAEAACAAFVQQAFGSAKSQ
jgi:polysaccharide pyruvyl transferase WcaK-like protein